VEGGETVQTSSMQKHLLGGVATGIGSLPHRDAREAAEFAFFATPELPCIPSLPRRSPAEAMIAQAVVGIRGISIGQYGSLMVNVERIDPLAEVKTDLDHDAFVGLRTFLEFAQGYTGPVKWQFTGPVTLGLALIRAGVPMHTAFEVAVRTVRTHVRNIYDAVESALPSSAQVVFIDEPEMADLMEDSFPIAPDTAIDLMSGALAAVEREGLVGLHCCSDADGASLLASGPAILSVPVNDNLKNYAGVLAKFLENGGVVAWGAVATDGPLMPNADRSWKKLAALWCELVQGGCDAQKLRQQSLITPACGLAMHSEDSAAQIFAQVLDIGERVRTQALATRLNVGA
jgi:methionine synthase II (cobalamin-independent)